MSVTHSFSYIICPARTYSSTYYIFGCSIPLKLIHKDFTNFFLAEANVSNIKCSFLSSNNHCGISTSSFSLLNKQIGKSASKYLIFILFILLLKLDTILLAVCNSLVITFSCYLLKESYYSKNGNFSRRCVNFSCNS